jgi:Uma2 family endonuclease
MLFAFLVSDQGVQRMTTLTQTRRRITNRFVVNGVSWRDYERIGRAFQDRPIRVTYDRGRLEIMTTSPEHERRKSWVRRLVETLIEELGIDCVCLGSMTFKRKLKKRGLEPDECFWIQNFAAVVEKDDINLDVDPPPDLVLEIEVSRSVLDRIGIYAALGMPEVWRCDKQSIRVCRLNGDKYEEVDRSLVFPFLNPTALVQFFESHSNLGDTSLVRAFREWVRSQFAAGWPNGGVQR